MYVFIIESFFNYFVNFFTGGRLICKLATIPGVHRLNETSLETFVFRKMVIVLGVICAILGAGFAMFNRKHIGLLIRLALGEQFQLEKGMKVELLKLSFFSFLNFSHFLILSLYPLLFYYMMTVFGRVIDGISESSQTGKEKKGNRVFHCCQKVF